MERIELNHWVDSYIEAQKSWGANESHPLWWAIGRFFELMECNPELCWQALVEISRRNPPSNVIANAGAGPLEDLIDGHGDQFIDRIELEARRSRVFREMLAVVWQSGSDEVWSQVIKFR